MKFHCPARSALTHHERAAYKDNVKVDLDSKLIIDFNVTTASVHDVNGAEGLFDENDDVAYGNAAYPSLVLPEGVSIKSARKGRGTVL